MELCRTLTMQTFKSKHLFRTRLLNLYKSTSIKCSATDIRKEKVLPHRNEFQCNKKLPISCPKIHLTWHTIDTIASLNFGVINADFLRSLTEPRRRYNWYKKYPNSGQRPHVTADGASALLLLPSRANLTQGLCSTSHELQSPCLWLFPSFRPPLPHSLIYYPEKGQVEK